MSALFSPTLLPSTVCLAELSCFVIDVSSWYKYLLKANGLAEERDRNSLIFLFRCKHADRHIMLQNLAPIANMDYFLNNVSQSNKGEDALEA